MVLGAQAYKPKELSTQINLNQSNSWGIFKHICDVCMRLKEGKYVIVKDPMKAVIRIYSVPENTFEDDDEEDDDGEFDGALVE